MKKIAELEEKIKGFTKELEELKLSVKEEELKEGDYVEVIKEGNCFTTHSDAEKDKLYAYGKKAVMGQIGKVIKYTSFWNCDKIIVVQVNNENYYLNFTTTYPPVRKITKEEIESHLIKEAEKKGFVKGAKVKEGIIQEIYFFPTMPVGKHSDQIREYEKVNGVNFLVIVTEWFSTPLKECELLPSHPSITINGYKAEFKDWGLDFNNGCATSSKDVFISLDNFHGKNSWWSKSNKTLTSVKIGNGEFTVKQIEEIANYYKSK
jgi:hypothetical protein